MKPIFKFFLSLFQATLLLHEDVSDMPFKVEYPIVIIKFTIEKAPTAILSQPTLFSFTRLLSHSFTLCLRSWNRLSATEQSEHVYMWGYLLEWMQVYFKRTSNVILCCPLYSAVNVFVCSLQKNMSSLSSAHGFTEKCLTLGWLTPWGRGACLPSTLFHNCQVCSVWPCFHLYLWPPPTKPFPFLGLPLRCTVVTFICTKVGEIDSQWFMLPNWTQWYLWSLTDFDHCDEEAFSSSFLSCVLLKNPFTF